MHLPAREVTNGELARRMPASAEFIGKMEASTAIVRRYWAPDDWAASDLAAAACRQALERAGRSPEEVDLIVLGTDSPDFLTPATSVVVQHKLGARNAGTFDVGCACASFPTGFAAAAGMMAVNPSLRTVLVVGVYLMHRLADPDDPTIFFYGDGAGAAVLEPAAEPGFVSSAFRADGAYHKYWGIYAGATAEPASEEALREGRTRVRFVERYPPEVNHQGWPRVVRSLAENGGFAVNEIDFLIFTQVRKPSIELVMAELGLPMDRTHTIMEKWGYTGSACVPMALHDALEEGRIAKGDLVVLVGSGVGYNQAGVALRWS
jgi:3-oxoacyl-[acyl-carrier-protein] synthase-3